MEPRVRMKKMDCLSVSVVQSSQDTCAIPELRQNVSRYLGIGIETFEADELELSFMTCWCGASLVTMGETRHIILRNIL